MGKAWRGFHGLGGGFLIAGSGCTPGGENRARRTVHTQRAFVERMNGVTSELGLKAEWESARQSVESEPSRQREQR